jgi:hypothetical protein
VIGQTGAGLQIGTTIACDAKLQLTQAGTGQVFTVTVLGKKYEKTICGVGVPGCFCVGRVRI